MTRKISIHNLDSSVTSLVGAGGGPKVVAIAYPGNDTAVDTLGSGTVTVTGSGFVSGVQVRVNSILATTVTYTSSTSIAFTAPANAAGAYSLYVINPDGGTAIYVPGIQYSALPVWSTSAGSLGSPEIASSISYSVGATGDSGITYTITSGALPPDLSLNTTTGAITGTAPSPAANTVYNFTVTAVDPQQQDTSRAFSINVIRALYAFTTYTFTSSGYGRIGRSSFSGYAAQAFYTSGNFDSPLAGYQRLTIPASGSYTITAAGAGGYYSYAGRGAIVTQTFSFTMGQQIIIVCGNLATHRSGGAGGSGVALGADYTTATILLVAGGGGSSYYSSSLIYNHAAINPNGSSGSSDGGNIAAVTNGSGGNNNYSTIWGTGGGGVSSSGGSGSYVSGNIVAGAGGAGFRQGGTGGTNATPGAPTYDSTDGGFGMGGGGGGYNRSVSNYYGDANWPPFHGGAGGYSGSSGGGPAGAGGGGSYSSTGSFTSAGSDFSNGRNGLGYVTITRV
jgi:Putative Ig domain